MRVTILILVVAFTQFRASSQSYTYDAFDRLTSAALNDSTSILYAYDKLGNRLSYTLNPTDAFVPVKVLLEGPYEASTSLQNDDLRSSGVLPTAEPYTAAGYTELINSGAQVVNTAAVFGRTGDNAITDWILVELRPAADSTLVVVRKAALVQRDGFVVETDGTGPIRLEGVPPGNYYVVIRHRNHLPIRSLVPFAISQTTNAIDFTAANNVYGQAPQAIINGVYAMYAGDANQDGAVNAVDLNAEFRPQNGQPFDYSTSRADFNADGQVNAVDLNVYWRVNNSRVSQGVD